MVGAAAFQFGEAVFAAGGGGAFESVIGGQRFVVGGAVIGVPIAHFGGHGVGVVVAGAEDDGFLLRPAGVQQRLKQAGAHLVDPVGHHQPPLER